MASPTSMQAAMLTAQQAVQQDSAGNRAAAIGLYQQAATALKSLAPAGAPHVRAYLAKAAEYGQRAQQLQVELRIEELPTAPSGWSAAPAPANAAPGSSPSEAELGRRIRSLNRPAARAAAAAPSEQELQARMDRLTGSGSVCAATEPPQQAAMSAAEADQWERQRLQGLGIGGSGASTGLVGRPPLSEVDQLLSEVVSTSKLMYRTGDAAPPTADLANLAGSGAAGASNAGGTVNSGSSSGVTGANAVAAADDDKDSPAAAFNGLLGTTQAPEGAEFDAEVDLIVAEANDIAALERQFGRGEAADGGGQTIPKTVTQSVIRAAGAVELQNEDDDEDDDDIDIEVKRWLRSLGLEQFIDHVAVLAADMDEVAWLTREQVQYIPGMTAQQQQTLLVAIAKLPQAD